MVQADRDQGRRGDGLNETEITVLDQLLPDIGREPQKHLSLYFIKIARLDGFLASAHDPPPGNIVIWQPGRHTTESLTPTPELEDTQGRFEPFEGQFFYTLE